MPGLSRYWFLLAAILLPLFAVACGGDDDDDAGSGAGDDDDNDDNDNNDNDVDDDDDNDDNDESPSDDDDDDDDNDNDDDDDDNDDNDDNDDDDDDDVTPDDYLAPWPQSNIEARDYDENPAAGELRLKAGDYDAWHLGNHQPYYGSTVETYWTDPTRATVFGYGGWGDACIWTGTYLGSQAMRYHVTDDAQARQNVVNMVNTLSGHLHVTGKPGFIARYRAPKASLVWGGDDWCAANDSCHLGEGEYVDDFWWGNTSRDQYTGWFYGMAMAYDLLDDEDVRAQIRADVTEVVHNLILQNWWILETDGQPTDAGPNVMSDMQLTWSLIAYHMTGDEEFAAEARQRLLDSYRTTIRLTTINFLNHYAQHYGNNLSHTTWYTLLRLGAVYFSEADYQWFRSYFDTNVHTFTRLAHNAWFNGIYMSQGPYEPAIDDDPYHDQLLLDLGDFRPAPNEEYALPERTDYELDPVSVFLADLMDQFPFLADLMGDVDYQALDAFPVLEQCTTDFLWQRNPWEIAACGSDNPAHVNPGVDYLVAYWQAAYHKFIGKDM